MHFSHLFDSGLFVFDSMSSFSKEMEGLAVVDILVSDMVLARGWVGVCVSVIGRA